MTAHRQSVVAVLGAGTKGAGIAQVVASAGVRVLLYDAIAGAAIRACEKIGAAQAALVAKGKVQVAEAIIATNTSSLSAWSSKLV
jgi:3-hydroxybutyryl-CoA dehydrogenase